MTTRLRKFYEAICTYWEIIFLWFVGNSPKSIYWLSGLKHIVRKFQTVDDNIKYPTGFLWAIGLYFAMFGLADQLYQGEYNRLISQVNQIRNGVVSKDKDYWIKQIAPMQNTETRMAPAFWLPKNTFHSFSGENVQNPAIIKQLRIIIEALKKNLNHAELSDANLYGAILPGASLFQANLYRANLHGAYLVEANLEGANLKQANLKKAIISGANFLHAENLTCEQLKSAIFYKKFQFKVLESNTIFPNYLVVNWNEDGTMKDCRKKN